MLRSKTFFREMHPGSVSVRFSLCSYKKQNQGKIMQSKNSDLMSFLDRRKSRRDVLKGLGTSALGVAALGLFKNEAHSEPLHRRDVDVLNFALNLEYLEAEYYLYATTGAGLEAQGVAVEGKGEKGDVIIKPNAAVPFATPAIRQYAEEIAADELAHVRFIRAVLNDRKTLAVARPVIDLQNSFTNAARAAGIIGPEDIFDPFADEVSFLFGAFVFEDVGVTAYKGGAPLFKNEGVLEAAAGILGVEAYHAGIIRTLLYQLGGAAIDVVQKISDLRDAVDGSDDRDQGLIVDGKANLVPTDSNGLAYSRSTRQVLNIVYLGVDAEKGGFFPEGLNGSID
jgi:hypothetical protein